MFGEQTPGEDLTRTYLYTDMDCKITEEDECKASEASHGAEKFGFKHRLDTVYVWELVEVGNANKWNYSWIGWNTIL